MSMEILFSFVLGIFVGIEVIHACSAIFKSQQSPLESIKASIRPSPPPAPTTKLKAKMMGDQHEGRIARLAEEDGE